MSLLTSTLIEWLKIHANSLDQSAEFADELLNQVAQSGIFRFGLAKELGGDGSSITKAIDAISEIAQYSLTAAFISWGHRTFIENVAKAENPIPRQTYLPALLTGEISAGTGLSNAVKFLSGVEELQVSIREENGKYYLNGRLPWVTNIRRDRFLTVFAAQYEQGDKDPIVLIVPFDAKGVTRTDDLALVALQGSNTAAIIFDNVELNPDWVLSHTASTYLANIRPEFLGLQCGMAFGLAERSLAEVERTFPYYARNVLKEEWKAQSDALQNLKSRLTTGLSTPRYFIENPRELFKIRIEIVDVVAKSSLLELQAGGGKGYLQNTGSDFIRRWRETAFLPVVTPSVVQLRLTLSA